MNSCRPGLLNALVALFAALAPVAASAHSASDAYLTLDVQSGTGTGGNTVIRAQWDIALRDLHFVLGLDDDGDGNITWSELRTHQGAIDKYAYSYLQVSDNGKPCTVRPTRQWVDGHADGAYAALFFDIVCVGAPKRITLDYRLFFTLDPSHRGILVLRSGERTATSLLSPQNARIELGL
jgi:hypothetical protein